MRDVDPLFERRVLWNVSFAVGLAQEQQLIASNSREDCICIRFPRASDRPGTAAAGLRLRLRSRVLVVHRPGAESVAFSALCRVHFESLEVTFRDELRNLGEILLARYDMQLANKINTVRLV